VVRVRQSETHDKETGKHLTAAPRVAKENPRNILTDNGFRQLGICPGSLR